MVAVFPLPDSELPDEPEDEDWAGCLPPKYLSSAPGKVELLSNKYIYL